MEDGAGCKFVTCTIKIYNDKTSFIIIKHRNS